MLKKIEDMNYYELLEVSPRATMQEIHKAYERIRRIYDPQLDRAILALLARRDREDPQPDREAYRTLIYEENRRSYDQALGGFTAPEPRQQARVVLPPPVQREVPPPEPRQPERPPRAAARARCPADAHGPDGPPARAADITECTGSIIKNAARAARPDHPEHRRHHQARGRHPRAHRGRALCKLPARPYLRGFLYTFARTIGYEPERIVNDYLKRYDAAMNPPKK